MFCSSPFSGGVFNSRFAVAAAPGSDSRSLCARRTGGAPGMLPGCVLLAQHGALPPCSIHGGCSGVQWGAARPGLSPSEPPATPPPPQVRRARAAAFYNAAQQNLKCTGNNSTIKCIQLCLFAFKLTLGMK